MIINTAQPIGCGNAARIVVEPTVGETSWRVLRNETGTFSGPDDSSAFLVYEGSDRFITDSRLLVNGVTYHYAVFGASYAFNAWGVLPTPAWSDPVLATVVPGATFSDLSIDVQEIVRERIDVTINSLIQCGKVVLSKPSVSVMSIPFFTQGGTLPVVTVLYGSGTTSVRGLGELVAQDVFDDVSGIGSQGWMSSITLEISAWSLNPEERNVLRRALEATIAANLWVLEESGLNMIEVQSVQDSEDTQSMNAPVYQTSIRLNFQSAIAVSDSDELLVDTYVTRIEV